MQQMDQTIEQLRPRLIAYRRHLHRFAEMGWTESRTASLVARRLEKLGLDVQVGPAVVDKDSRMGLPTERELAAHWQRTLEQGGDRHYLEMMHGGYTGVVGTMAHASGPTIGLRFDTDALGVKEASDEAHRRQG